MFRPSLLALCASTLLLAACPSDPPGVTDEGSSGIPSPTEGMMTSSPMTTEADSGSSTAAMTSDGSSSSGSPGTTTSGGSSESGPPPDCREDSECQDDSFCNGMEVCSDGSCEPGEPPVCDDGIDCTIDSCDDGEGACVHDPDDTLCGCAETCDVTLGCGNHCIPTTCQGQIYLCGNCIDDDMDCGIDTQDSDCWGPCHNNESGWSGEVPGQQNQSECTSMDCYFDPNSGGGNDECYWSHACDPLEPSGCTYDPDTNIPGASGTCAELQMAQDPICLEYCDPLTPNGCDCFGCCEVQGALGPITVYLGTRDPVTDVGTCNLNVVDDPVLCNPCTQVSACLNTCEMCELCIGQEELPPGCTEQDCPAGIQPCGLDGQAPCPEGLFCNSGCCFPNPQ